MPYLIDVGQVEVTIILSIVFIMAIGVNIFTYAYSGKNVWEYFLEIQEMIKDT